MFWLVAWLCRRTLAFAGCVMRGIRRSDAPPSELNVCWHPDVTPLMSNQTVLRLTLMIAPALPAQDRPKFEVATIKPAIERVAAQPRSGGRPGGGCPQSLKVDRSRVDIACATLTTLIGFAYRFSPDRVTGPDWMVGLSSPKFDIAAKLPEGASKDQVPEMIRSLLAERFKLAIHHGTANRAIYALVVTRGGPKMQAVAMVRDGATDSSAPGAVGFYGGIQTSTAPNANGRGDTTTISNPRMGIVRETTGPTGVQRWEAASISLEGLADLLDKVAPLSSPIIDATGLRGRYQMGLEVVLPDPSGEHAGMEIEERLLKSFNDGLRKLGLQLERRKGLVETLAVDHVEKIPTAN